MADPRSTAPRNRQANLSPLMTALHKSSQGEKVNFCPFGCELEDLDDHGYCKHLVGFTVPGDDSHFQPRRPRRAVLAGGAEGPITGYFVDGTEEVPVVKGDRLELITVCSRVYRKSPNLDEIEEDKRPESAAK